MAQRIAIVTGMVAAAVVLAVGLAAAGLGPVAPARAEDPVALAADTGGSDVAAAFTKARTMVDTVYVRPAPKARVIHVTRHVSRPKATARPPIIVHKVVPARHRGGDDEGEGDGEGDGREPGGDD